jgi:hypothetical protein
MKNLEIKIMIGLIVSISFSSVWLLFELKDFFFNGGFKHDLAFGLLKISVLIPSLLVLIIVFLWSQFFRIWMKKNLKVYLKPYSPPDLSPEMKSIHPRKSEKDKNSLKIIRQKSF